MHVKDKIEMVSRRVTMAAIVIGGVWTCCALAQPSKPVLELPNPGFTALRLDWSWKIDRILASLRKQNVSEQKLPEVQRHLEVAQSATKERDINKIWPACREAANLLQNEAVATHCLLWASDELDSDDPASRRLKLHMLAMLHRTVTVEALSRYPDHISGILRLLDASLNAALDDQLDEKSKQLAALVYNLLADRLIDAAYITADFEYGLRSGGREEFADIRGTAWRAYEVAYNTKPKLEAAIWSSALTIERLKAPRFRIALLRPTAADAAQPEASAASMATRLGIAQDEARVLLLEEAVSEGRISASVSKEVQEEWESRLDKARDAAKSLNRKATSNAFGELRTGGYNVHRFIESCPKLGSDTTVVSYNIRNQNQEHLSGFALIVYQDSKAKECKILLHPLKQHQEFGSSVEALRQILTASQGMAELELKGSSIIRLRQLRQPDLGSGYLYLNSRDKRELDYAKEKNSVTLAEIRDFISEALLQGVPREALARSNLVLSPDGPLANLPFDVLQSRGIDLASKRIVYTHSLDLLRVRDSKTSVYAGELPVFILAQSNYQGASEAPGNEQFTEAETKLRTSLDTGGLATPLARLDLPNLSGVKVEANQLASLWPGAAPGVIKDARSKLLIAEELERMRPASKGIVLFAAHGIAMPKRPDISGLVLGGHTSRPEDGYLTAIEIAELNLKGRLVAFSACFSGLSSSKPGLGAVGVPYAALLAGAQDVLVSLLPLDDAMQAIFMQAFFDEFNKRRDVRGAMAAAKSQLRAKTESPRYWAGMAHYTFELPASH